MTTVVASSFAGFASISADALDAIS